MVEALTVATITTSPVSRRKPQLSGGWVDFFGGRDVTLKTGKTGKVH